MNKGIETVGAVILFILGFLLTSAIRVAGLFLLWNYVVTEVIVVCQPMTVLQAFLGWLFFLLIVFKLSINIKD
jgi:hypothetical protein